MLPEIESIATVVVCEDDEITRDLLCENLNADRFTALPAATAEDALRLCRYHAPDVLLVDLALPDASGLDVLRRIRSSDGPAAPFDASLPVIVLSGLSGDGDRVRGLTEGADDYMTKPSAYLFPAMSSGSRWRTGNMTSPSYPSGAALAMACGRICGST